MDGMDQQKEETSKPNQELLSYLPLLFIVTFTLLFTFILFMDSFYFPVWLPFPMWQLATEQ